MPSRLGIAIIMLFWLAVTGTVIVREVLPRFDTDAPPAVLIDLSDEATHRIPAQWGVFLGPKRIGTLNTQMSYDPKSENYTFSSTYNQLELKVGAITVSAPKLKLTTEVTRDGAILAQGMTGDITAKSSLWHNLKLHASIVTRGTVANGVMTGHCTVKSDLMNVDEALEPVPVPAGQVLHPLQPMNRLRGVQPGNRWTLREVNPLTDAIALLVKKVLKQQGVPSLLNGSDVKPELTAEVRREPVNWKYRNAEVPCWVIDYRGDTVTARTWVAVSDGKVLKQEAGGAGETLELIRED